MNNPFYNRIVPAEENGVCWEVYCSNIRLNKLTSGCLKSDATGGMLGRTSTWLAVLVFLCQGTGLMGSTELPQRFRLLKLSRSEIFCSWETRVQVALFMQWSAMVLQNLTVNTTYFLLGGEEVLPRLWWKRERAELFVDRSGTIKSWCVSQLFSAPGCDSYCFTQITHALLKSTIMAPWLHTTLQDYGLINPHQGLRFLVAFLNLI